MGAISVLKDAALEMKQTAYGVGQEWGGGVAGQGGRAGSCSGCSGKFVIILLSTDDRCCSFLFFETKLFSEMVFFIDLEIVIVWRSASCCVQPSARTQSTRVLARTG